MILTNNQLNDLWAEYENAIVTPDYKSDTLFLLLLHICTNLIVIKQMYAYEKELKDTMVLNAIIKCYKSITKYDTIKGLAGQKSKGHPQNKKKSLYGFIELCIIRSFFNSIKTYNSKKVTEINISFYTTDEGQKPRELADIQYNDVDIRIDNERKAARAAAFNIRLDEIENQLQGVNNGH